MPGLITAVLVSGMIAAPAGAQTPDEPRDGFTPKEGVSATGRVQDDKAPSSALAETDPALLAPHRLRARSRW